MAVLDREQYTRTIDQVAKKIGILFGSLGAMDMKPNDTPQDGTNQDRRGFLKTGAASIAAGLSAGVIASRASGEVTSNENNPASARAVQQMMPTRNLGKTGFRVGIFGLGGQGALEKANNALFARLGRVSVNRSLSSKPRKMHLLSKST